MSEQATQNASRESVLLKSARAGAIGVKAGMTQVYTKDGQLLAVTVIDLRPNIITQVRSPEKDGYKAIQVGVFEKKASKTNKAEAGHVRASQASGFQMYKEFRLADSESLDGLTVGKALDLSFLKEGDLVDLSARSKGKGTQGGMKRFHMAGGFKTHGASISHRSLGSIGNRADPGKCFRNKKMPGHMGYVNTTIQNVRVVKVDAEKGLLLVHGSVPGSKSGIVTVRRAVKAR